MKSVKIDHSHLSELFAGKHFTTKELSELLNISTTTLWRWKDPKASDPSGVHVYVLLPLLIEAGIEVLPPPDPEKVARLVELYRSAGVPAQKLKDEKILKALRFAASLDCKEVRRARALVQRLDKAWRLIDQLSMPKMVSDAKTKAD
jgi:hypothetical protein